MENKPKQTVSELIKEATEKGVQVVIIGAGAEAGKHAALISKMEKSGKVLLVPEENLTDEDKQKINEQMAKPKENPFEPLPIPYTMREMQPPEIFISDEKKNNKGFFEFPKRKKLKGYQKGKR